MKRSLSVLIVIMLGCIAVTGCKQTVPAPIKASEQASVDPPQRSMPDPVPLSAAEAQGPKPVEMAPKGHETGIPKEEPVVSSSKKPEKISSLKPIYSVGKGEVAITIDDGPTKYTGELFKVLKEQNVRVTFFFIGQNAAAYPESVTEAVYLGHAVGYHSDTHPHMSTMTFDDQEKEFDNGLAKLQKWDKQPVTLFRPPYGAYNNDTKLITEAHHMGMVLWNEDPRDWATTDPAKIARSVLAQVQSGSIIVMHDHPSTIAALPAVIKGIRSKGYKLVTISAK